MDQIHAYIIAKLEERRKEGNLRSLKLLTNKTDFCSNDYLGLARDLPFQEHIAKEATLVGASCGSTGSRLLSGNNTYAEALETKIAAFHKSENALLFNSGFDANYGLLSALPYRGDTILYDELVHASVHDGIRGSKAFSTAFGHNDMRDLGSKLKMAEGRKYVVTESLFSMDGDQANLQEMAVLCRQFGAGLIVDEAHATGVIGPGGAGLVNQLGLEKDCLARIHTFGKALGAHGAVLLSNQNLRDFLINFCRPLIFSTALPLQSLVAVNCAYDYFPKLEERRRYLQGLIALFRKELQKMDEFTLLPGNSPVQSVIISGNDRIKLVSAALQQAGYDARPILSPTVAKGSERIRIALHSFNTAEEVRGLAQAIKNIAALKKQMV